MEKPLAQRETLGLSALAGPRRTKEEKSLFHGGRKKENPNRDDVSLVGTWPRYRCERVGRIDRAGSWQKQGYGFDSSELLAHHALVALRDHIGLNLLGRVNGDTDEDQQGSCTKPLESAHLDGPFNS